MAQGEGFLPGAERATGSLIVILGPSGSGKDTLMSFAASELAGVGDVLFVRRAITRPAGSGGEDHIAMSEQEFDAAIDDGQFSLTWAANGLRYGLPRGIAEHLAEGKTAVVNGSRGAWPKIRQVFPGARAVEIRVEPSILAERLKARGREAASEIEARLVRAAAYSDGFDADFIIDNSGPLEKAGAALVSCIKSAAVTAVA